MISHASSGYARFTGFRSLRATRGRAQLDAVLALFVLAWALRAGSSIEWERVALIIGLLRACRATGVEWFWARLL
ncbi:hypothetical protein ABZW10_05375 [Kitasatospora sp. NPDC004723]|uniref:hypothetical protein n=1 Tax=Kitasatospora sp. NPDC004723 TaxID=3154288 RepID=UPI0033B4ED38